MIKNIMPKSPVASLDRDLPPEHLKRRFDADLIAAVVGMNRAYLARALGRPGGRPRTFSLEEVLVLLDLDGYQETFVPRSKVPAYLLNLETPHPGCHREFAEPFEIIKGDARKLIPTLAPASVQCVVTSSPYWAMRLYDTHFHVSWADGETCPYGFEQTPEGFIRHTVELLQLIKPALTASGSVWWNLMDTYNTRTPIRGNARERLDAMGSTNGHRVGWTEHTACRHSAGHMYLDDAEQCSIPMRVAERASRIGYKLKSFITWRKHGPIPESAKSRVSRQAEYVIHLALGDAPTFEKTQWQALPPDLGGPDPIFESREKITDVWSLATSAGKNGHGAEFPLTLPARCVALASQPGDLVLDPFVGSGTTALAALALKRRCIGFDVSDEYIRKAKRRLAAAQERARTDQLWTDDGAVSIGSTNGHRTTQQGRIAHVLTSGNGASTEPRTTRRTRLG